MSVSQSADFRGAANLGRRTFLDTGSGNATIEIYAGTRPAAGEEAGGDPLVLVVLAKPCGVIDANGALALEPEDPEGELIVANGTATWARFLSADGVWAFDADVTNAGGGGEVQFPNTTLFEGGRAPLSPSTIG